MSKKSPPNTNNDEEFHDDVEIEMEEETDDQDLSKNKMQKLRTDLKKSKEEAKANLDGWQRSRADYVNLQKQLETEKGMIRRRAIEGLILEILPTLDNFEMAMKDKKVWESVDENWRKGIEYIYSQLQRTLIDHGAELIDNPKIEFDPQIHEPLDVVATDDVKQDGKIIEIMQKGYMLNGNIVRPAKVKIYRLEK